MKKVFLKLLNKFSKTEKDRIEIMRVMNDKVSDNYPEQTAYGNVYNYFIEFVMANPFIVKQVISEDNKSLEVLKKGINNSFDIAVEYIKKEMK